MPRSPSRESRWLPEARCAPTGKDRRFTGNASVGLEGFGASDAGAASAAALTSQPASGRLGRQSAGRIGLKRAGPKGLRYTSSPESGTNSVLTSTKDAAVGAQTPECDERRSRSSRARRAGQSCRQSARRSPTASTRPALFMRSAWPTIGASVASNLQRVAELAESCRRCWLRAMT